MNNLICQQLFLLLLKYGKVSKEEKDIYLYGIEIILEKAENLFFVFIIIYMYKKWIEGLLFIAIYSILRKTGGGYHAKTSGGCILFTIAIVNVFFQLLYSTLFKPEMELFMLFSLSFIYIIAPVDCRNNPLIGKPKKNYLFVILMIILCVYWGMIMINKEFAKAIFYIVNIYLLFFGVGYFLIICYQLYENQIMQLFYEKERKQELEENNKKMLDKHYEMIEEKNRRYRKLEHDIYKHLNTLEVLSQGKDRDVISNYIMEIKEQIANLEETFILKNKVLQILVNGLYKKASNDNILCRFDIVDMDLTFLNSYDLTTLFGNLLDNAYEACLSVDEKQRFIYMHLYRFNNFIILCICNSYRKNENTNLFGSHIVFKESDKGIGLNNVTDVINKYNGQMEILRKQEEFEVRIVLPIS